MKIIIKRKTGLITAVIIGCLALGFVFIIYRMIKQHFDVRWNVEHVSADVAMFQKEFEFDERMDLMAGYKMKLSQEEYLKLIDRLIKSKDVEDLLVACFIVKKYAYCEFISAINVNVDEQNKFINNWSKYDSIYQFGYTKEFCVQQLKSVNIVKEEIQKTCADVL